MEDDLLGYLVFVPLTAQLDFHHTPMISSLAKRLFVEEMMSYRLFQNTKTLTFTLQAIDGNALPLTEDFLEPQNVYYNMQKLF